MKKDFITIVCLFIIGESMAQNGHLSFKGVPIDGKPREYITALCNHGFESIGTTEDGYYNLMGRFVGYDDCSVMVESELSTDLVSEVFVIFPSRTSWAELIKDYNSLKAMLLEMYGRPSGVDERIDDNASHDRIKALNDDKITWGTLFSSEIGSVEIYLVGANSEGCVVMLFNDKKNRIIKEIRKITRQHIQETQDKLDSLLNLDFQPIELIEMKRR